MSVTRYDMEAAYNSEGCYDYVVANPDAFGRWVKFDDYEQLASEYDYLKEKYDTLVAKIYGVYMGA